MNKYKEIWNKLHKEFAIKNAHKYDDWLVKYDDVIKTTKLDIIDLGCGSSANNTIYLLEKGKSVVSCDFSEEAIDVIKNINGSKTKLFDMLDGLPFEDNFSDIVIADLSLHYFNEENTFRVLNEIKRVLTSRGYMFVRLNSTSSIEFKQLIECGVEEIEEHFFYANNMEKRFFSDDDIKKYFDGWEIVEMVEENMTRWSDNKIVWKVVVQSKK